VIVCAACGSRINVSISRPISSTTSRSVRLINFLVLWPVNWQPWQEMLKGVTKEGGEGLKGGTNFVLAFIKSGFS